MKTINRLKKIAHKSLEGISTFYNLRDLRSSFTDLGIANVDRINTYTKKEELVLLYRLAKSCAQGSKGLELGSYLGASTCYIVAGLFKNNGHLFCVDTWNNETMPEGSRDTYNEFLHNIDAIKSFVTPIRKRSEELTFNDMPNNLALIFLDGDHSYEATKIDFEIVQNFLDENGIVVFHDCFYFEGVTRVVGEALASGKWVLGGA